MDHSQSYSQAQVSGLGQTELESRALIRTAAGLNQVKEHWEEKKDELGDVLEKNRKLWAILASAMKEDDCPQPPEIRRNILSLAVFIFQRTVDIIAHPDPKKLDVLININMNLAKGLSGDGEEK
ncbi:MAG: flagellar biosynthesis regulator FlaF [Alphaproteobacteria bacterium]|nr:flagellar biosynthesis regulator FlaF [Alphaproteobacteria bacterium]